MDQFSSGVNVQVVRPEPCCGSLRYLGRVFTVERVVTPGDLGYPEGLICGECGQPTTRLLVWEDTISKFLGFFPETLKRLPDMEEKQVKEISKIEPITN